MQFTFFSSDAIGIWEEEYTVIMNGQGMINSYLFAYQKDFYSPPLDFSTKEFDHFTKDLDNLFCHLSMVEEKFKKQASEVMCQIKEYVQDKFIPELRSLQVIILLSSFINDGKPIIDIFHINENLRSPTEFSYLFSGSFVTFYYKVTNIGKISFISTILIYKY
jgi:hypothetical protein